MSENEMLRAEIATLLERLEAAEKLLDAAVHFKFQYIDSQSHHFTEIAKANYSTTVPWGVVSHDPILIGQRHLGRYPTLQVAIAVAVANGTIDKGWLPPASTNTKGDAP